MAKRPQLYFVLISLTLIMALTGCALNREADAISDTTPLGELPTPTLAPLGADSNGVVTETEVEVTAAEVVSVDGEPAAAQVVAVEAQEVTGPAVLEAEIAAAPASNNTQAETASVEPEVFTPPVAEAAEDTAPAAGEAPIIVDATSEELPIGGPIAANPPPSDTVGDYGSSGATIDTGLAPAGGTYTVRAGDTLFSLSVVYDTNVQAIMQANGLDSDMIYEGQVLTMPGGDSGYTAPAYDPALSEGYDPSQSYDPEAAPAYDPAQAGGGEMEHMVSAGETLFSIAQMYGAPVELVAEVNEIGYPYLIYPGQYLTIPSGGYYPSAPIAPDNSYAAPDNIAAPSNAGTHTVSPGETLFSIAQRYGTTAQVIAEANGISNPNQIYVGQVLYLP